MEVENKGGKSYNGRAERCRASRLSLKTTASGLRRVATAATESPKRPRPVRLTITTRRLTEMSGSSDQNHLRTKRGNSIIHFKRSEKTVYEDAVAAPPAPFKAFCHPNSSMSGHTLAKLGANVFRDWTTARGLDPRWEQCGISSQTFLRKSC